MRKGNFFVAIGAAASTVLVGTHLLPPLPSGGKVLSATTTVYSSPSPIPSSTPLPTLRPTPRPTRIPIPTTIPQPKFTSEQIYNLINQYAGQYGIDPNVMRHMALCESGFNPFAKNHIYAGLFQYDAPTWKSFRKMMHLDPNPDLRFHAEEAIKTTAFILSTNRPYLWPNCYPR